MEKRSTWFAWLCFLICFLYLTLPLLGSFIFSLQKVRGTYSFAAYQTALTDARFVTTFLFSVRMAFFTIIASLLLIVPTAYWVHLRTPKLRPVIELITLLPFVIPAIVLVFGFIKTYSRPLSLFGIELLPPLTNTSFSTNILLVCGYTVLAMPYFYRAVDTGLRAIDVRTLTEAAQSLGANRVTILWRVIFPNLRGALLSGALLTFATVIGEFTFASFLARPAFAPYLRQLNSNKVYEPVALSIISFALTWLVMLLIQWATRDTRQGTLVGAR